mgnify:CR=1 FL=1
MSILKDPLGLLKMKYTVHSLGTTNLGGCRKERVGGPNKVETATLGIVSNLINVGPHKKVDKKSYPKTKYNTQQDR